VSQNEVENGQYSVRENQERMGVGAIAVARRPVWDAFSALADAVMHQDSGGLGQLERELLGAYLSKKARCTFCHLGHLDTIAELAGEEARELVEDPPPRVGPLLSLADAVAANAATDTDFERLRAEGYTPRELEDVVLVASLFGFANRMMMGFGIEYVKERDEAGSRALAHGYGDQGGQPERAERLGPPLARLFWLGLARVGARPRA